jgi:serine/threonine-protein phosphatase 2B catalytic subunit
MGGDPNEENQFLFMGDFVDRGNFGTECILLLLAWKINEPDAVFLLRGNHECRHITVFFNFKTECLYKYSEMVYDAFMDCFDCLPLAAILNSMFCVHGGISPQIVSVNDINQIDRFVEIPSSGPMCDMLWSDPFDEKDEEENEDIFIPNYPRSCSYKYSFRAASVFLKHNNLISIIRAHEAEEGGYKLFNSLQETGFPSVITIFSAPNYCDTYGNSGAFIQFIKSDMNVRQFSWVDHPFYLPQFENVFKWSLPFLGEKVCEILGNIHAISNFKGDPNVIHAKILSLARVSSMYQTLKQERDNFLILKNHGKSHLLLTRGSQGIRQAVETFAMAKQLDDEKRPGVDIKDLTSVKATSDFLDSPRMKNNLTRMDSPTLKVFEALKKDYNRDKGRESPTLGRKDSNPNMKYQ